MPKRTDATAAPATTLTRSYAGIDPAERTAQRRARFVETGVRLFGTIGYHGTTIRTLATEAGLNNRYFYESFETTEDLLVACYEHLTSAYRTRLSAALQAAPADLESKLRAGVTCYFEEMRNPHFARITQVEVMGVSPRVDSLYVRTMRQFAAVTMEAMSHFELASDVTPRDLEIVGYALVGAVTVAGSMWVRGRYRDELETVVAATLKILLGTARQLLK